MRLRLTLALVLSALPALAEPLPAPGYGVAPVASSLRQPSGLALDGAAMVVTDRASGRVVRIAEDQSVPVNQLPLETFQEAHVAFGSDVFDVFVWERSVEAREAPGGTARKAVLEQITAAEICLQ